MTRPGRCSPAGNSKGHNTGLSMMLEPVRHPHARRYSTGLLGYVASAPDMHEGTEHNTTVRAMTPGPLSMMLIPCVMGDQVLCDVTLSDVR